MNSSHEEPTGAEKGQDAQFMFARPAFVILSS